jgi:hypothetical protein
VTVLKIHPEKTALPASSQLSCEIGPENAVLLLLNPLDREWLHQRRQCYPPVAVTHWRRKSTIISFGTQAMFERDQNPL